MQALLGSKSKNDLNGTGFENFNFHFEHFSLERKHLVV